MRVAWRITHSLILHSLLLLKIHLFKIRTRIGANHSQEGLKYFCTSMEMHAILSSNELELCVEFKLKNNNND